MLTACILWEPPTLALASLAAYGKDAQSPCSAGRRAGTARPGWPLPTASSFPLGDPSPATSLAMLRTAAGGTGIDIFSSRTAPNVAHAHGQQFPRVHLTFTTHNCWPPPCYHSAGRRWELPSGLELYLSSFRDPSSSVLAQDAHTHNSAGRGRTPGGDRDRRGWQQAQGTELSTTRSLNKVSLGFLLEHHSFSITTAPFQVLSCAGCPKAVGFTEQISHLIIYSHGSFSSARFMHFSSKHKILLNL